ncbi:MAG: hypothetical protein M3220_16205 [Chloroflexota bacterium]|nr:hypothetical protein [Chloroflexota bacterium]
MTRDQLIQALQEWWPGVQFEVAEEGAVEPRLRVRAIKTNAETGEQTTLDVVPPEDLLEQPKEVIRRQLAQDFEPALGPPNEGEAL